MPTFIDESGDTGLVSNPNNPFFRLCAVSVPDLDTATRFRESVRALRKQLGLRADYEFHFTRMGHYPDRTRAFFRTAMRSEFRFASVALDKRASEWCGREPGEIHRAVAVMLAATPILHRLIRLSAVPLKAVETTFAADSSGFGSSRFIKWFDTKHGTERRQADWVKVHIMCGVKTNIVTAVGIGDEHDSKHFPGLLEATAETFTIGDVTADKAYLSLKLVELVGEYGGEAFIPPKVGSKADRDGEAWRKMFHLFALNRDEFLRRYHQRSNVESAFSMMKRKFGDAIRSKTPTAMVNESLAKVLCHNLSVLVHEMYELGIEPQFGGEQAKEADDASPKILRFPSA